MIVVAGEALVDLVVTGGDIVAAPGGAPYNVARGCARLGRPAALLAAVSTDGFGERLATGLATSGVHDVLLQRTELPTTLAVAEVDPSGGASYRFYTAGTSAPSLAPQALPASTAVLVTGGLGLVLDPMATAISSTVLAAGDDVLVVVDLNCRPAAITDRAAYVARLRRLSARTDVVKASDEDLAWLHPDLAPCDAAAAVLAGGSRVVLVTRGATATTIVTAAGSVTVPVEPVLVVDTIGAGDAFTAGFVSWWRATGRARRDVVDAPDLDVLRAAVTAAHAVAAVVVGRRGSDPPTRGELPAAWA